MKLRIRKGLSKDSVEILDLWRDGKAQIEWTARDAFRVWYKKPVDGVLEFGCKEFLIKEVR